MVFVMIVVLFFVSTPGTFCLRLVKIPPLMRFLLTSPMMPRSSMTIGTLTNFSQVIDWPSLWLVPGVWPFCLFFCFLYQRLPRACLMLFTFPYLNILPSPFSYVWLASWRWWLGSPFLFIFPLTIVFHHHHPFSFPGGDIFTLWPVGSGYGHVFPWKSPFMSGTGCEDVAYFFPSFFSLFTDQSLRLWIPLAPWLYSLLFWWYHLVLQQWWLLFRPSASFFFYIW